MRKLAFLGLVVAVATLLLWWTVCSSSVRPLQESTKQNRQTSSTAEVTPQTGKVSNAPIPVQRQALANPELTEDPGLAEQPEPYQLAVLVCNESGAPVSGAYLVLSCDGSEQLTDLQPPSKSAGMTDAIGMASVRVMPGFTNVAASKVGVGISSFVAFGRLGSVRIKLTTLDVEVRGHVVDHLERGVQNAKVRLHQSSRHFSHRMQPDGTLINPVHRDTRTAADGSFSFRASRSWGVCIVGAQIGAIGCRPIETEPGEEGSRHLRLEVPGRFMLRGIVLDWRGQPVPSCEVYADQPTKKPHGFAEGHTATTDAAGQFEIPFLTGGRCEAAPLGTRVLPAGPTVVVELAATGSGWVELHTSEPATLQGTVLGLIDDQPTRILVRPVNDKLAGMRELHSLGNDPFVLSGLMRGVAYNVFAFQGDEQLAEATATAGQTNNVELRSTAMRGNAMQGNAVLACKVTGNGVADLIGTKVMVSAHAWDGAATSKLGIELVAKEWRVGASVQLEGLPELPAAVAVVSVDGHEVARSEPLRLGDEPAHAVVDLHANGTIELTATIPTGALCFAQVLYADGRSMHLRSASRLNPSRPFKCTIPAGRYLVRVTTEDSGGNRVVDLPCLVTARETVYLRP